MQELLLGLGSVHTLALGYIAWRLTNTEGRSKNQMVVDTSGLIDGRIIDIVRSGFTPQRIVIPQFVVAELQHLADQADAFKRERARFGLDVVQRLQEMRHTEVVIARTQFRGITAVDDKLVALAKKQGALLYTTDFNLNQVAQIEGVRVLNVNELAQGLRATRLPGEKAAIKITQLGQDKTQGVGYLDDGTMVVVEQAGNKVGQLVQVEFSRMLQTQAGKMMFARMQQNGTKQTNKSSAVVKTTTKNTEQSPAKVQTYHAVPQRQPKQRAQNTASAVASQQPVVAVANELPSAAQEALAVLAQPSTRSPQNRRRRFKPKASTTAPDRPA